MITDMKLISNVQAIYFTLNMFSVDGASKCLVAECWIPNADTDRVSEALKRANVSYFSPDQSLDFNRLNMQMI